MSKTRLFTVALFSLVLGLGAFGSAFAGDGKACGDKKKDKGDSAVLVTPAQPLA